MKSWVRKTIRAGAVAAGLLLFTASPVQANDAVTGGNLGVGSGNQLIAPIQAPVNACGNAIAVLGDAGADCRGGATAKYDGSPSHLITAGNVGVLNGNQLVAPIQAPVNVCGNAVGVAGKASAGCRGGADAKIGKHQHRHHKAEAQRAESLPLPALGDLTSLLPVTDLLSMVPVADQLGTLTEKNRTAHGRSFGRGPTMISHGNLGILSGNQVYAPIQIPVDVSGNAVGVGGDADAGSLGGANANL